jgi:hypothetical protein
MERISELGSVVDVYVLVVMTGPGGAAIWAFATRHRDQPQCDQQSFHVEQAL